MEPFPIKLDYDSLSGICILQDLMDKHIKELRDKVRDFPPSPGVYIMKDSRKKIIYVGKALNLKNRVYSYFSGKKEGKTAFLVSRVQDIETIHTETEYEALILENNLIKKWKPRYNIRLKDGKTYPVIRITHEPYPRVFRTRSLVNDKSIYFGPFSDVKAADIYMEIIRKIFPIRRCSSMKGRKEPCLYYHMKRCSAPCVKKISPEDYAQYIRKIRSLLSGKTVQLLEEMNKEMRQASKDLAFEKAAELRDAISSIEQLSAGQTVQDFDTRRRDYLLALSNGSVYVFVMMQFREGKAAGREIFVSDFAGDPDEALQDFVCQYYIEETRDPPSQLFLETGDTELIETFFREEKGITIKVEKPRSKRDQSIIAMARENGLMELDKRLRKKGDLSALEELKAVLGLRKIPHRIEGFDIAQLKGRYTVASLISFKDGAPDRKNYRHFRMESMKPGEIDDFKAISEAVARRYTRVLNEDLERPDLVLIDGGKGQVSAAWSVLQALGLAGEIQLCGLAKREELIYLPDRSDPVDLPEGDPGLRVLQNVRDETHRFATSYNQKLRRRDITLTTLESVPGIGKKRSEKLLTHYGSLDAMNQHSAGELANTAGVALEVAETLKVYLSKKEMGNP